MLGQPLLKLSVVRHASKLFHFYDVSQLSECIYNTVEAEDVPGVSGKSANIVQ